MAPKACEKETGKGKEKKEKGKYMSWTVMMDKILTEKLVEEYHMGHKGDNGWRAQSLQVVIDAIYEKVGIGITKDNIKSRLKTWRKLYTDAQELLNQSGFGWNETKKMVEADDEAWDLYLKGLIKQMALVD